MLRLDFYVQHLMRQQADEVHLSSGSPVRFKFADGDRQSSAAIEHAQIVQLVQEAAPMTSMDELKRLRRTMFRHQSAAGITVRVEIDASSGTDWKVRVRPDTSDARPPRPGAVAAPAPEPEPPAAAAPAAPPRREPAEPEEPKVAVEEEGVRFEGVSGEPRINQYLRAMVAVSASDLHLSTDVPPMVRRHGEMQLLVRREPMSDRELREILLEVIPDRNKEEFMQSNDTDFAHAIEGVARFRMNYFMDRKGIGAVARQIPFAIMSPEKLGIPPRVLDLCDLSKGLVLVTGPTGSGKSTTLATLIDVINARRADHIITIEDPIEFVHPNKKCLVNQREVGVHTKGFKAALRAALREDPDIVLVGEMRDLETISIAIETAETGHLVFGTLHTTSAPSTVDRIIDQFPADRQSQIRTMLSESLRGVVAQMLCKKKGGGRVAAYEVMIANAAVSNLIREGKTYQLVSVMQTGRHLGMQTMNDHLLDLVRKDLVEPLEAYLKSNDKQVMKELLEKNNFQLDIPEKSMH